MISVKLGSHRSDDTYRLGQGNLIVHDLSPEVRRQYQLWAFSAKLVIFFKKVFFKLSTADVSKVIVLSSKAWP